MNDLIVIYRKNSREMLMRVRAASRKKLSEFFNLMRHQDDMQVVLRALTS